MTFQGAQRLLPRPPLGTVAQIRPQRREGSTARPRTLSVQSDLSSSCPIALHVGSLRSTGVGRFTATMDPSDSRTRPRNGYLFPSPVARPIHSRTPRRVSQVPDASFGARRPQPPREARRGHSLVGPPRRWQASPNLAGWPASISVTRPKRVRLRYGSRLGRPGLRRRDRSRRRPVGYQLNEQLAGQPPFMLQETPSFAWRTRSTQMTGSDGSMDPKAVPFTSAFIRVHPRFPSLPSVGRTGDVRKRPFCREK